MSKSAAQLTIDIESAQTRISTLFLRQCTYGQQTKTLEPEFAACGQFIGDETSSNPQFGLHGIAAALRVLGPVTSAESTAVLARIIRYCEACFGLGTQRPQKPVNAESLSNVIKLGELLYGLSFVATARLDTSSLVRHVVGLLENNKIRDQGWGYFLTDGEPELLPTAYAIRGLAGHGVDVSQQRRFVLDKLQDNSKSSKPADVTTAVACAYCLAFPDSTKDVEPIRKIVKSAWKSLEQTLREDIEQNLEYSKDGVHHYVRVPMQLYLLALGSEFDRWRFSSVRPQRRLQAILAALLENRFSYPYSGTRLSARTNAIAYDCLTLIRDRLRNVVAVRLIYHIDQLRMLVGSKWVTVPVAALAFGLILYSGSQWLHTGTAKDLGPDLIASFLVLLLASARR